MHLSTISHGNREDHESQRAGQPGTWRATYCGHSTTKRRVAEPCGVVR
ncbi:MAG: hypothetical protein IK126_07715 [Bacteroidales bacterium]|nr:hypothetical protein [Bacteroidales bacterium]